MYHLYLAYHLRTVNIPFKNICVYIYGTPTGTQTEQGNLSQKRCDLKNVVFWGGTIYIYTQCRYILYICAYIERERVTIKPIPKPYGGCLKIWDPQSSPAGCFNTKLWSFMTTG